MCKEMKVTLVLVGLLIVGVAFGGGFNADDVVEVAKSPGGIMGILSYLGTLLGGMVLLPLLNRFLPKWKAKFGATKWEDTATKGILYATKIEEALEVVKSSLKAIRDGNVTEEEKDIIESDLRILLSKTSNSDINPEEVEEKTNALKVSLGNMRSA